MDKSPEHCVCAVEYIYSVCETEKLCVWTHTSSQSTHAASTLCSSFVDLGQIVLFAQISYITNLSTGHIFLTGWTH